MTRLTKDNLFSEIEKLPYELQIRVFDFASGILGYSGDTILNSVPRPRPASEATTTGRVYSRPIFLKIDLYFSVAEGILKMAILLDKLSST